MPITINHVRENDNDFTVFFTIDISGESDLIEFHGDIPKEEDHQEWLEKKQDFIRFLILQKMYRGKNDVFPDWVRFKTEENTDLEAFQEWISKGHKNKIQIGLTLAGNPKYVYEVIEKQELEYRHPKSVRLLAKIEEANITPEMKDLLKEIVK